MFVPCDISNISAYPVSQEAATSPNGVVSLLGRFDFIAVFDKDYFLDPAGLLAFCSAAGVPFLVARIDEIERRPPGSRIPVVEVVEHLDVASAGELLGMQWPSNLAPLDIYTSGTIFEGIRSEVGAFVSHKIDTVFLGFVDRRDADRFIANNAFPYMSIDVISEDRPYLLPYLSEAGKLGSVLS